MPKPILIPSEVNHGTACSHRRVDWPREGSSHFFFSKAIAPPQLRILHPLHKGDAWRGISKNIGTTSTVDLKLFICSQRMWETNTLTEQNYCKIRNRNHGLCQKAQIPTVGMSWARSATLPDPPSSPRISAQQHFANKAAKTQPQRLLPS